jgi:uncharacterized protein (TIGR03000 family)
MMKRTLFVCTALGMLALLVLPDVASAQRRGGGGGRGGESSWGGGWDRGWGGGWGRGYGGGYGYGYPGYYGGYYGGRYGYGYPYSRYGGYDYGYQPYATYDYGYQPTYDYGSQQPYYTYEDSAATGADSTYSDQGSMDAGRSNNAASLRVILPAPDAKVWVEGQETRQRGTDRVFISPPLERGKSYNYTVKAQWNQDGRQVERQKTVPVQAGRQAVANFRQGGDMDRRMRTGTRLDQNEEFDRARDNRRQFDNQPNRIDNQPNRTRENRDLEHPNAADRTRTGAHHQFDASHPFMGKVVSVNDDQVIVADTQGKEHTFRIPASADVMVQGNKGSASSLKPGMQITITPETDNMGVASKIEATSQDRNRGTNDTQNRKLPTNRRPQ